MALRRFVSHLIDEAAAAVILHKFLWHRGHPPATGKSADCFPGLLSGDLATFFSPMPEPLSLAGAPPPGQRPTESAVEDFRFPSPVAGPFEQNNTVYGRRWRSSQGNGALTVIAVYGLVQLGTRWQQLLAECLDEHGIDVATFSTPYNHLRTPRGYRPGQLVLGGDLEHQLSAARQGVLDLWTVVRSLQAEGRRVGLVGVSHGGWLCLMASLLAQELEFVVALAPPVEPMHILGEGGTIIRALRRGLGDGPHDLEKISRAARAVTPGNWRPRLDPDCITLHAARYDRFVPPGRIVALARRWGTRLVVHEHGHVAVTAGRRFIGQVAGEICSLVSGR
jgi:hypothetical protein